MASLYDDELNILLDQSLPARQFLRRPRPSDPWFDSECRQAKRLTRRLERASAAASRWAATFTADSAASAKAAAAKEAWYEQRRVYRQLRHRKSFEFWRSNWWLINQIRESCGSQWTFYWDVAVFPRAPPLTSRRSTAFSLTRSEKCGATRKTRHRLHLVGYALAYLSQISRRCRSMTSSLLFGDYQTSHRPPTRYRRTFSSRSSIWLRRSSSNSSIAR